MKLAGSGGPKTSRGQQDRIYAGLVISDIVRRYGADPRLGWLVNEETARWSILAELGRLREQHDEEAFWEAVAWVLENQPKVKSAVAVLRRYRNGSSSPGSIEGLHRELVGRVNDYLRRHPDTPPEVIEEALRVTLDSVERMSE